MGCHLYFDTLLALLNFHFDDSAKICTQAEDDLLAQALAAEDDPQDAAPEDDPLAQALAAEAKAAAAEGLVERFDTEPLSDSSVK